jgi:glycine cleavage system H protein
MLGETVDFGFQAKPGEAIDAGQVIGWVEGFKAIADLFCIGRGRFTGSNPALEVDPTALNQDPHGNGWLYEFIGQPDETAIDVHAYARHLDAIIDELSKE